MKIRIKTTLIELEVEDQSTLGNDNYIKRKVESLQVCVEAAIKEAITLHNAVVKTEK